MSMSKFSTFTNVDYPLTPKIPEHWRALPCRAFVAEKVEKNNDGIEREYLSLMSNVGVIRYSEKGDVGNKAPDDLTKCKVVEKGNLVINSMNYSIGSYGISPYDGVCSPVYIVLEPITSVVLRRFALRIFENKEFQNWAQSFGSGILAHRAAIGWDDLKNIIVGIPPLGEQQKIAQFLDYETAKIDALIDEQKRLIELLKEKRQAVISHAVTKGLNPDAPMKDSGVEWLGEVPEHWRVASLKFISQIRGGLAISSQDFQEEGIQIIRIGNLYQSRLDLSRQPTYVSENLLINSKGFEVDKGDILMSLTGTLGKRDYGFAVLVDRKGPFLLNQRVAKLIPDERIIIKSFLLNVLLSDYYLATLYSLPSGTKQANLSNDDVLNIKVAVPASKDEQLEIVDFVAKKVQNIDALLLNAASAINLLKERRSALISAAVTGKIDVRDWQPPTGSDTVDSNASVQTERHYG